MARPTFKAYMENIEAKSGKTPGRFLETTGKKGFVKHRQVVARHGKMLKWIKSEIGLGHVHANFIILVLRLRANDPKVSAQARAWAYDTGYKKSE